MRNLLELILIVLVILIALGLFITWAYWPDLRAAHLAAKRHKSHEEKNAIIIPYNSKALGTPIKPENDFSPMFHGF